MDDIALRKGHNYGTILVELETHQPIVLLPDRFKTYKRRMSKSALDTIRVVDRFHLLQNLEEKPEKTFKGHM
ncbi:MAG: hypothetical protein AAF609_25570 [Cyanobacteria bacterium P01_C01_bin.120]